MPEQVEPNFDHDAVSDKWACAMLEKAMDSLEHEFDTVVILTSRQNESGGTVMESRSAGNWYAQNGMMRHLLKKRDITVDVEVRRDLEDNS